MKKINTQLISAKVDSDLYEKLKLEFVYKRFKLTQLIERSMYLYLIDKDFQNKIHNTLDINLDNQN